MLGIGKDKVILISLHVDAVGNDREWMNARGWNCYTTRGKTNSDGLAMAPYEAAKEWLPGMRPRTDYTDVDPDIEKDFCLLRHTQCPAVLTENLFMDKKEDVAFLEFEEGVAAIIQLHLDGILQYTFQ